VERAGTLDKEALRRAAASTNITQGRALILPQKRVTFGANGQNPQAMWIAQQYINGKPVTIWPAEFAQKNVKPIWPVPPWEKRSN
jgi:branched-chain amino acid transport system substrate-binding protein